MYFSITTSVIIWLSYQSFVLFTLMLLEFSTVISMDFTSDCQDTYLQASVLFFIRLQFRNLTMPSVLHIK